MKRPTRPIDPNDAPEYEADLDAYDRHQSDLEDMERDNNETENDNDNE